MNDSVQAAAEPLDDLPQGIGVLFDEPLADSK
jgi:hypothetical protein